MCFECQHKDNTAFFVLIICNDWLEALHFMDIDERNWGNGKLNEIIFDFFDCLIAMNNLKFPIMYLL